MRFLAAKLAACMHGNLTQLYQILPHSIEDHENFTLIGFYAI